MMRRGTVYNVVATFAGAMFLSVSFLLSNFTLVSGHYRSVLQKALVCSIVAATCFCVPLARGPTVWRCVAGLLLAVLILETFAFAPRIMH